MSYYQLLSIEIIKAIPIFIIGLITGYIAWKQYKVEKSRLNSELSDKRLNVFKQINLVMIRYTINKPFDIQLYLTFSENILYRHSVFSKELNDKIDALEKKLIDYMDTIDDNDNGLIRTQIIGISVNIIHMIQDEFKIQ